MITTIILDRGHATLDTKGNYITPGKQFEFENGLRVYEGYENQKYVEALAKEALKAKLNVVYTVNPTDATDPSLVSRVKIANRLPNKDSLFYLSIHNNAGKGKGTEVFTSKGDTRSDKYAESIIYEIQKALPTRIIRTDLKDKDKDKEEDFYVLKQTIMPAVLMEYGFFDNKEDYEFLSNPANIELFAKATIAGIIKTKIK
jgi:N-acetylmuramoyl-L-alanine amidase